MSNTMDEGNLPIPSSLNDDTFDGDDLLMKAKVNFRRELNEIDSELQKLVRKRQVVLDKLKGIDRLLHAEGEAVVPATEEPAGFEIESGSTSKAIRQVARELYVKLARPIRRDEILETLTSLGTKVGGKNPLQTVTRVMTRSRKEFKHLENGYVLCDGGD